MNPYLVFFAHVFIICLAVMASFLAMAAVIVVGFIIVSATRWLIYWIADKMNL